MLRTRTAHSLLVLAVGLALTSAAIASPHRVLWVQGTVTAKTLGEGKSRALELQPTDTLPGKVRIVVPPKGELWFLEGGVTTVGLRGPGVWELHPTHGTRGPVEPLRVSVANLGLAETPAVPWTEIATLHEVVAAVTPRSPVETSVTTRRPVLRWSAHPTVLRTDLTLSRRNDDGTIQLVERWRGLTSTHHEVSRPLTPGHDYLWTLRATEQSDATNETKHTGATETWFRVLSEKATQAVRGADATISTYQLDTPSATKALEVVRALMWEHHGLTAEAREAWDEILLQTGDIEAVRRYRARLNLRALAAPRAVPKASDVPSVPDSP